MEIIESIKNATELTHKVCNELNFMDRDNVISTLKSEEMESLLGAFYKLKYFIYRFFDDN